MDPPKFTPNGITNPEKCWLNNVFSSWISKIRGKMMVPSGFQWKRGFDDGFRKVTC
jgi:hypothetical protein